MLRPDTAGYDAARQLFNPRFDEVRPAALARCASAADVQRCVEFASRYGVALSLRSGGHSYGGASTGPGLVLDTSALAGVTVSGDTVTVGAGAQLVDVYDRLAAHGRAIAAGSCPTVGIAGLTLGGGVGVLSRGWGLACDSLIAVDLVTADGRLRHCDRAGDTDLFWACQGGGGGSFGVVTALTYRTRPAPDVTVAFLRRDWRYASEVLAAWQSLAPSAPDSVWSNCHLLSRADFSTPKASVGVASLSVSGQRNFVSTLTAAVGAAPASSFAETLSYRQAMLLQAGCSQRTVLQCHRADRAPTGQLPRAPFAAKSDFITRPLGAAGIAQVVAGVERRQAMRGAVEGGIAFDAAGGAIGRVGADATAFPHRDALYSAQYTAAWTVKDSASTVDANMAWLRGFHDRMRPYVSGGAYVNYADPDLTDYPAAYWAANYPRLQRVKAKYDPHELFTHPQAVRPR